MTHEREKSTGPYRDGASQTYVDGERMQLQVDFVHVQEYWQSPFRRDIPSPINGQVDGTQTFVTSDRLANPRN